MYIVELKAYKAAFDATTGNMMKVPHCNIEDEFCDTGESTIIYKGKKNDC